MKKLFIIIFCTIFICLKANAHYDMNTPVEGASIANNELQFQVIKTLYKAVAPTATTCTDYSIYNTQLLHYPYDVKKDKRGNYVKGYWKELWTVDTCGTKRQFPVTFTIKKKKTNYQIDSYFLK